jgi:hypothetical protein
MLKSITNPSRLSAAGWCCVLAGVILLQLLAAAPLAAREKTDVVVLGNGARLLVEIRSMSRNLLEAKTLEMGTVRIEWEDVVAVSSTFRYDLEMESGEKYIGTLEEGPEAGLMVVRNEEETVTLEMARVVYIYPLDVTYWRRLRGSVNVGYSMRSEDHLRQLSLGLDLKYPAHRFIRRLSLSSYYSDQDDTERITRNEGRYDLTRFLLKYPRWGTTALLSAQQDSSLALDRRLMGGGLIGHAFIQTNRQLFFVAAGGVYSIEKYDNEEGDKTADDPEDGYSTPDATWEAAILIIYEAFRYDFPEFNVDFMLGVFPGITISDRRRVEFSGRVSYEVFQNFTVGLSLTGSHDTRPPVAGLEESTYIASFTVGYKFN